MTAIVTGVKTIGDSLSVNQFVPHGEPKAEVVNANKLTTILEQAKQRGLSVGIVSTARITHATPAATYAHTAERDWEGDAVCPPVRPSPTSPRNWSISLATAALMSLWAAVGRGFCLPRCWTPNTRAQGNAKTDAT